MKTLFISDINYILEGAFYLEKRVQKNNDQKNLIKNFINYGVPRDKVLKHFTNYQKLMDALENEVIDIDPDIIPFLKGDGFNNSLAVSLYFYVNSHQSENLEKAINKFFSITISTYLDKVEKEQKVIEINNLDDLINHLNAIEIEDATKMNAIRFYHDYEYYYQKVHQLFLLTSRIIFKYNYLVKDEVLDNFNEARERIMENNLLTKLLESDKPIKIQPSIFGYNKINLIRGEDVNNLCYGYLYFILNDLKDQSTTEETLIVNALKALGDKNRFQIVSILQNKKLYLQALSRMVNLTPATVSYHLEYLKRFNLIEIDNDGITSNKIYYRLNRAMFNKIIYSLNSLMAR